MAARLTIMPPYRAGSHQPDTILNIWVNNDIYAQVALGHWRKRVKWLPKIWPNRYWDDSFDVQEAVIKCVEKRCEVMFGGSTREFYAKGGAA